MFQFMSRGSGGVWFAALAISGLLGSLARADDIEPPPWRNTGLYTIQEWEFRADGPSAPDGTISTINPGAPSMLPGPGLLWADDVDGMDGYWGTGTTDSILIFDIPNYIDLEPYKLIRVQINGIWNPGLPPPSVTEITAVDNLLGSNVAVGFDDSGETSPGYHRWEDWYIFPNPDFEQIIINVPVDSFVNQVVIETTSVPEPTSLSLLALGGVGCGLIVVRQRRKKRQPAC